MNLNQSLNVARQQPNIFCSPPRTDCSKCNLNFVTISICQHYNSFDKIYVPPLPNSSDTEVE